jgi:hypothetical protein
MSSYVRRTKPDGGPAWVGPIRFEAPAERERDAWASAGQPAEVFPATPEVRALVRLWERSLRGAR